MRAGKTSFSSLSHIGFSPLRLSQCENLPTAYKSKYVVTGSGTDINSKSLQF